ncbi:glycosyltransferase family 4 protein [Streptomyces sp. NPDC097617]|uniref:glycosyltransferase family 4 protein n=1 Tax=Streptomyces sp. NPDC097617 TaxID=3366091 RepID=UPI0038172736
MHQASIQRCERSRNELSSESGYVVVLLHEGFYGAVSGSGFSNRAFLTALAQDLPHGLLVVVPVVLPPARPGRDPQWEVDVERMLAKAGARVLPLQGEAMLTSPVGCEALSAMAVRRAAPYLQGRSLLVGCDVPFLAVGSYAPKSADVLLVPRSTAAMVRPEDSSQIAWERRGLTATVAGGGLVAAISDHMRDHLTGTYGLPDGVVLDLPNGLMPADQAVVHGPVLPLPAGATDGFVLAMGRAVESKGFADLLHAVGLLGDQGVAVPHLVLVAASTGERNSHQVQLRGLIDRLGIEATLLTRFDPRVRGWLGDPSLRAVVVPSRAEPFGRIPLEAFAAGAGPVVATTAGGLAQTVLDGVTGYSAPPASPQALAVALHRALDASPADRARLAEAGARLLAERHDYAVSVRSVLERCAPWALSARAGVSQ